MVALPEEPDELLDEEPDVEEPDEDEPDEDEPDDEPSEDDDEDDPAEAAAGVPAGDDDVLEPRLSVR